MLPCRAEQKCSRTASKRTPSGAQRNSPASKRRDQRTSPRDQPPWSGDPQPSPSDQPPCWGAQRPYSIAFSLQRHRPSTGSVRPSTGSGRASTSTNWSIMQLWKWETLPRQKTAEIMQWIGGDCIGSACFAFIQKWRFCETASRSDYSRDEFGSERWRLWSFGWVLDKIWGLIWKYTIDP